MNRLYSLLRWSPIAIAILAAAPALAADEAPIKLVARDGVFTPTVIEVPAGKSVRPVVELAGITDILTKAYGSTSPKNLVKAAIAALRQLHSREQVEQIRGVVLPRGTGELVNA